MWRSRKAEIIIISSPPLVLLSQEIKPLLISSPLYVYDWRKITIQVCLL